MPKHLEVVTISYKAELEELRKWFQDYNHQWKDMRLKLFMECISEGVKSQADPLKKLVATLLRDVMCPPQKMRRN